jgi:hypothetical protein
MDTAAVEAKRLAAEEAAAAAVGGKRGKDKDKGKDKGKDTGKGKPGKEEEAPKKTEGQHQISWRRCESPTAKECLLIPLV